MQWNDCKGFLATWVRHCLSLSHPLLLPTIFPMVAHLEYHQLQQYTNKWAGPKRFGNGKCGRASHSASISSLFSSLWNVCNAETHMTFFFNCGWVDAVYWNTYLSCVSACVFIHWVSSLKLHMRAILTEIWICLHIWDCWKPFFQCSFLNLISFDF